MYIAYPIHMAIKILAVERISLARRTIKRHAVE